MGCEGLPIGSERSDNTGAVRESETRSSLPRLARRRSVSPRHVLAAACVAAASRVARASEAHGRSLHTVWAHRVCPLACSRSLIRRRL